MDNLAWHRREVVRNRNETMEILESAQYDSTTDREMKRNNVCVARNDESPSSSLSYPCFPCPFASSQSLSLPLSPRLGIEDLLISSAQLVPCQNGRRLVHPQFRFNRTLIRDAYVNGFDYLSYAKVSMEGFNLISARVSIILTLFKRLISFHLKLRAEFRN